MTAGAGGGQQGAGERPAEANAGLLPLAAHHSPLAAQRPSAARIWLSAARLRTLPAAAAPVLLGTAFAASDGAFHAAAALCALASAVLIQVGTNYVNDAEDFVRGADTAARVGPARATAAGWVTAGGMRRAAAVAFGLAFLCGLFLVWRGGWPILALGLVAIAAGVGYTKGRFALAYTGLADGVVLAFFGPVAVGGTYLVQALALPEYVLVAGLGPGALATAILVANNVRDVEQDRAAGKRTLVVRLGRPFGVGLYAACLALAAVAPLLTLVVAGRVETVWPPVAVAVVGGTALVPALWRAHGAAAAPLLGRTAALLLVYAFTLAAGWLLG